MPRFLADIFPAGTFSGREQPVLTTEGGRTLRPFTEADAPAVFEALTDPDVQHWFGYRCDDTAESVETAGRFARNWSEEKYATWAIVDDGRVAGRLTLVLDLEDGAAEIVYWANPGERGRGVVPDAVRTIVAWAFAFGFHRLFLQHSVRNTGSCRVAEKAGIPLEGTRRSAINHPDGFHDVHVHALIAGDERAGGEH
ncbi:GNAT family N-acetyltransferase [Actinocorallia lasiicapitis]